MKKWRKTKSKRTSKKLQKKVSTPKRRSSKQYSKPDSSDESDASSKKTWESADSAWDRRDLWGLGLDTIMKPRGISFGHTEGPNPNGSFGLGRKESEKALSPEKQKEPTTSDGAFGFGDQNKTSGQGGSLNFENNFGEK